MIRCAHSQFRAKQLQPADPICCKAKTLLAKEFKFSPRAINHGISVCVVYYKEAAALITASDTKQCAPINIDYLTVVECFHRFVLVRLLVSCLGALATELLRMIKERNSDNPINGVPMEYNSDDEIKGLLLVCASN